MSKNLLLYLIILFLTSTPVLAQRNFVPGYIVQQNDTIHGQIDQRGAIRNSLLVSFKKTEDAPIIDYYPNQISAYAFSGNKIFESKTIGSEDSTQQVFLNVLVKGPVSLYSYRDQGAADKFFIEKEGAMEELVEKTYFTTTEKGAHAKVTSHLYRGVLSNAFKDCKEVAPKTKNLIYGASNFSDIVTKYNKCIAPTNEVYQEKIEHEKLDIRVIAGFSSSAITFPRTRYEATINKTFFSPINPIIGLSANIDMLSISEKLSFEAGVLLTQYKYHSTFKNSENAEYIAFTHKSYTNEVRIDLLYANLPILLKYSIPTKRGRPFISAGIINGILIKENQDYTRTREYNDFTLKDTPPALDLSPFIHGVNLGGGIILSHFPKHPIVIEGRFELASGFSKETTTHTKMKNINLTVGYQL